MKGFVQNIEDIANRNKEFRKVLYTASNIQLVVMALNPKEEIGIELHELDQFFRVEEGTGEAFLDGVRTGISAGFAVLVPAGTKQHHQYWQCAIETLYALRSSESPRWCYSSYARRSRES
jgi:mannose-6-phosphate isomerase-like protein (cupin superfamily)